MPTLPASGYPVPQAPSVEPLATAPGGFQDIHATTDMFGGASALALSNLGSTLGSVKPPLERWLATLPLSKTNTIQW